MKEYVLFLPSGRDVPSQNEWIATMYGLSCLDMSQRNPSCVSTDVSLLLGIAACSYGPGFGIEDTGGADDAAFAISLLLLVLVLLSSDVLGSSGGASGAGGGISSDPGGGRGGASQRTFEFVAPILISLS